MHWQAVGVRWALRLSRNVVAIEISTVIGVKSVLLRQNRTGWINVVVLLLYLVVINIVNIFKWATSWIDGSDEIRCGWASWTSWTRCSSSCGEGIRVRERPCKGHSNTCRGRNREEEQCTSRECDLVDGKNSKSLSCWQCDNYPLSKCLYYSIFWHLTFQQLIHSWIIL